MSGNSNKYNLAREIPEPVKRQVRKNCGFGCVRCGNAIIDYHHHDPPYRKAREHKVEGIVLLCPNCHSQLHKGLLSSKAILRAAGSPASKQKGFSFGAFETGIGDFCLQIGPYTVRESHAMFLILGTVGVGTPPSPPFLIMDNGNEKIYIDLFFVLEPAEDKDGPLRVSAKFYDANDRCTLIIYRNEWRGAESNWDMTSQGNKLEIWSGPRQLALRLKSVPSESLTIERMHCQRRGVKIDINQDIFEVTYPSGEKGEITFTGVMTGGGMGIDIAHNCFCLMPGQIVLPDDGSSPG
jgi:hypothetical protein